MKKIIILIINKLLLNENDETKILHILLYLISINERKEIYDFETQV